MIAPSYESVVPPRKPPTGPHMQEAEWVRAIFESSGLSQEAFAAEVGVSRSALTGWLSGNARIRSDSQRKLKRHAPPGLPEPDFAPNGADRTSELDPTSGRHVEPDPPMGVEARTSMKPDIETIAERLDAFKDPLARSDAVVRAIDAINDVHRSNPRKPGAGKTTGRARTK